MRKSNRTVGKQTVLQPDQPIRLQQFGWMAEWSKKFKQEIQKPIQMKELVLSRSQSQRCTTHNIILSIYCTFCRKTMCASCMYSSLVHRKHRVVPVQSAVDQIKEDKRNYQFKIPKIHSQILGLLQTNSQLLINIDKKSASLHYGIKEFYQNLIKFLSVKQIKDMARVKQFQQTAKREISTYSRELTRMNTYISSKYSLFSKDNRKPSQLVSDRSILELLMQSSKFIKDQLLDTEQYIFPVQIEKIKKIQEQIEIKVNQMVRPVYMKGCTLVTNGKKYDSTKTGKKSLSNLHLMSTKKRDAQMSVPQRRRPSLSAAVLHKSNRL